MAIPAAIERIQNLHSVIRYTTPLKTPANKTLCIDKPISSELATTPIPNTDLYRIVSWVHNPSTNFVAQALVCARNATTSR